MTHEEKQSLFEFLKSHTTLALATLSDQGVPHVAPVYYAHDESWSLIFMSKSSSLHSISLEKEARCAASIYQDEQDRDKIRGIQLRGCGYRINHERDHDERNIYLERYPFVKEDEGMYERFLSMTMYRLKIQWLRLIDNSKGFGYKQEWSFD